LRYPDPEIQQEIVRIVKLADQYLFLTSSQTLYLREIDSSSANRLTNDHGVSSNVDAKDVERGNAARMESDTNIEDAPSPEDAGTRCDGVFSDKSELNTALRLRFCLIEDLVTGRRPISARLTSGGVS
jgi:hypothetical protein